MGYVIKGLGTAASQIKDAADFWMIKEEEVDLHYILYRDKVTALLSLCIATIFTKELYHSVFLVLVVLMEGY